MVVTQKTKPDTPQDEPERVLLELCAHNRYVIHGNLYEKGKTYEFTPETTTKMLRLQSDSGIPVFRRWFKKANTRVVEVPGPQNEVIRDPVVTKKADPKAAVELGDDAEIADVLAAISVEDDENALAADALRGDMTRADLGAGVRVG